MRRVVIPVVTLAFLLGFILCGCNLFDWVSSNDDESAIDRGRDFLREGEYAQAAAAFAEAMEQDPADSEARYLHAKAVVHGSGYNALTLGTILSDIDFEEGKSMPFSGSEWPVAKADQLNQVMQTVVEDLTPIYEGRTHGTFDSSDIALDYGIAMGIDGMLFWRDTDLDGYIDEQDFDFNINYSQNGVFTVMNLPEYLERSAPGGAKYAFGASSAVSTDSLIVLFNTMLDSAAVIVERSYDIIVGILSEDVGLDLDDIEEILDRVVNTAHYYKINDAVDNDGDFRVDEEVINARDDDGDHLYDEDSHYP